jgi:hypothetical protein
VAGNNATIANGGTATLESVIPNTINALTLGANSTDDALAGFIQINSGASLTTTGSVTIRNTGSSSIIQDGGLLNIGIACSSAAIVQKVRETRRLAFSR